MPKYRSAKFTHRALAIALVGGLLVACSDSGGESDAVSGLIIVPVFGSEYQDVTADVDWFGSQFGKVENVRTSSVTGEVTGYDFSERLRSSNDDNVLPVTDGEIGVALSFKGYTHYGEYELPAAEGNIQRLEVPVWGVARLDLTATDLEDDASVELSVQSPTGVSGSSSGWANVKGIFYTLPGYITVTLTDKDTGREQSVTLTVFPGQTVPLTFDFTG